MTVKLKRRHTERGQAIAELTVCLILLLAVLLGFFFIATVTNENVSNAIAAREDADRSSRNGSVPLTSHAKNISTWDYGGLDIPFTNNDIPREYSGTDANAFIGELSDHSGQVQLTHATDDFISQQYNSTGSLSHMRMFLNAARLANGTASESDPLGKHGLDSLKGGLKRLLGVGEIHLIDRAYMPAKPDVPEPQLVTP